MPVPPARWRARLRGLDPAAAICAAVAAATGLPVASCLRRTDAGRQTGRPRERRLADPPRIAATAAAPLACVLVDDVLTTGATLAACAAVLRDAGAGRVVAVTFARSPARQRRY